MHTQTFESAHRRPVRWFGGAWPWSMGIILSLVLRGDAQNGTGQKLNNVIQQPIGQPVGGMDDIPRGNPVQNERLIRALNADRQKSLISDTNKLIRLVNELNAEIASTGPDSLTADQLHKLAEIEKLAHNVKFKMSTPVRTTPAYEPPFQTVR